MMVTLKGEVTLVPKHSVSPTKRERRIIPVQSRSRVLMRSGNCIEKMGFGTSSTFGRIFGLWFLVTRATREASFSGEPCLPSDTYLQVSSACNPQIPIYTTS